MGWDKFSKIMAEVFAGLFIVAVTSALLLLVIWIWTTIGGLL